jgi:hypothetical protein
VELRPADGVFAAVVDGEAVLLDRDGQYWTLNRVGTRVWTALAEFGDEASMYTGLAREFDVDPDLLQRDIDALIAELQAARLIVARSG